MDPSDMLFGGFTAQIIFQGAGAKEVSPLTFARGFLGAFTGGGCPH